MIISVDFDGTLHYGTYPAIGLADANAIGYMQRLADDGHYIITNTCRQGDLLIEAINWLLEQEIPFNRINDNCPANSAKYGTNARKIFADVYVDDRQVGGLPSWQKIYEYINSIKKQK